MKAYHIPPLLLLLLLPAYLLHTRSCRLFNTTKTTALTISGSKELKKVVESASMEDNTVILTLLDHQNPNAASLLNVFLESFRIGIGTRRFLNHLIILSSENQAFGYCKSVHRHCYNLADYGRRKKMKGLDWKRNLVMEEVLDLGYSIFYTDMDVVWLRNPFPHFTASDIFAAAHQCTMNATTELPDGWVIYLKAHESGTEFIKLWNFERFLYVDYTARSVLEMLHTWSEPEKGIELLEPGLFSSGCEGFIDMGKACIVRPNCGEQRECKPKDLQILLSQWRNFTQIE